VTGAPVDGAEAADLLRRYYTELVARYQRRPAREAEVDAALAEEPSGDLAPPRGTFLLARCADEPAGCVGVRLLGADIAEVKRLFVRPRFRGLGFGSGLLVAAERAAAGLGARAVRLDTRHDLVEARGLYAKHAYLEIAPYSNGRYAEHWFEKVLTRDG
jgi:GNAT superfamily N-acetyltransferase